MKLYRNFSLREKILLGVLILLILAALYYFAVQLPVSDGLQKAQAMIEETELNNTILQSKAQKLQKMKSELTQIKESGNAAVVPEYDNLYNEISFLNKTLEKATNFQLNFDDLKMDEDSNVIRRTGRMEFTCNSYADAKEIVCNLENCPYLCRVSSLVISVSEDYQKDKSLDIMSVPVDVKLTGTFFERAG